MEDVLAIYTGEYDAKHPLICMDETSKQQVEETRLPLAAKKGKPRRYDYEYRRGGVSNLFLFFDPVRGWRNVVVSDRRTKRDWAHAMAQLAEQEYPDAERITVVLDNLNTHTPSSFYETFEPGKARQLAKRFDFHYTPKHGSWLNMAEIEFSVLSRECLSQRIPDQATLKQAVAAWQHRRNARQAKINWRFTTDDSRIKLKHLYPSYNE